MGQEGNAGVHVYVLMLFPLVSVILTSPPVDIGPLVAVFKEATSEEHAEEVVRVEFFLMELLAIPLLEVFFSSVLIVKFPLVGIADTSECLADFLEGFSRLRGFVLVRVEFEGEFPVSFFNLILVGGFLYSQDIVVVLFAENFFAAFDL